MLLGVRLRFFYHHRTGPSQLRFVNIFVIGHQFVDQSSVLLQTQFCVVINFNSDLPRGFYYFFLIIKLLEVGMFQELQHGGAFFRVETETLREEIQSIVRACWKPVIFAYWFDLCQNIEHLLAEICLEGF